MTTSTVTATLTQLVLNPRDREVARDLTDCHRMHQRITALCCPPDLGPGSRAAAGVLHRVEDGPQRTTVLVQSLTTPDPERLPAGYTVGAVRDMSPLLEHLTTGMVVRYRIAAAPVRYERKTPEKRATPRGVRGNAAVEWWHTQAQKAGLVLDSVMVTREERLTGIKTDGNRRHTVQHPMTQFEGAATVTDVDLVRESMLAGIGRGKSYGCGMLSLAPTRTE